jgi:hypothetical protein
VGHFFSKISPLFGNLLVRAFVFSAVWAAFFVGNFSVGAQNLHHYIFFDRERERIEEPSFLQTKAVEGAQLKYIWRELERQKDQYDFTSIRGDLASLQSHGKKLWIQLQDASFDAATVLVPRYLTNEPAYHGGADKQYEIKNDDEATAVPAGWVARRHDPVVRERFHRLLFALGKEFDGRIEGINLPETAVDFGESGKLYPSGFTPENYRAGILTNMAVLKRAFPKSAAMQYANFMPGEWLPEKDRGHLRAVYGQARELGVGLGGPDLLPYRPAQMAHAYPLIRASAGSVPTGIAVQWGNYEMKNVKTDRRITVPELIEFATNTLRVKYMFWCTQEPFYSRDVLPHLRSSAGGN